MFKGRLVKSRRVQLIPRPSPRALPLCLGIRRPHANLIKGCCGMLIGIRAPKAQSNRDKRVG